MTIHHGLLLERLNDKDVGGNPHRPRGFGRNGEGLRRQIIT